MKTIYVDEEITEPVSELLSRLEDKPYQVTKVSTRAGRDGVSGIEQGVPYVGKLRVIANIEGNPHLIVGSYPWGGMVTSTIVDVKQPSPFGVEIHTLNSIYLVEPCDV